MGGVAILVCIDRYSIEVELGSSTINADSCKLYKVRYRCEQQYTFLILYESTKSIIMVLYRSNLPISPRLAAMIFLKGTRSAAEVGISMGRVSVSIVTFL